MTGSNLEGSAVVIMGVTGAGKSTIGEMLAKSFKCEFLDADDFHPQSNIDKMACGIPLSDEDRIPWLELLRDTLRERVIDGQTVILACSALKKQYREILRSSDPDYKNGSYGGKVKFVLLDAEVEVIAARLNKRAAEGNHFMSTTLLQSQLDLLQIDDSEKIIKVNVMLTPEEIVNRIQAMLFY